jgi:hypothetical protein
MIELEFYRMMIRVFVVQVLGVVVLEIDHHMMIEYSLNVVDHNLVVFDQLMEC